MKEKITYWDLSKLNSSFSKVNMDKHVPEVMQVLTENEIKKLELFYHDKELCDDILMLIKPFFKDKPYGTPKEMKIEVFNNEKRFPKIKNLFKILTFIFFILSISHKIPRPKLIYRRTLCEEFGIDSDTLIEWMDYFNFSFKDNRKFTSREYRDIVNEFTGTDLLNDNIFQEYFYQAYDRKILFSILFDDCKSGATKYRQFDDLLLNIDALDSNNKKVMLWISNHRKLPFSLAFNLVELLKKYNRDFLVNFNTMTLLKKCWEIQQNEKPSL